MSLKPRSTLPRLGALAAHREAGSSGNSPWDLHTVDNWFVRAGLASILLVNAVVAFRSPGDFEQLLGDNLLGSALPGNAIELLVGFAALNDMVLGLCVLFLPHRRLVFFWVSAWFLVVAGTKSMNLIW